MVAMYLLLCFSAFGIIVIMCFLWAIWCWLITWKDDDNLWYLVRPFEEGEEPTEYLFKEESAYNLIEGTVKIIEHKKEE